ncbi:MAG: efflux RND transporter periplasmic adaptor subunit [Lachnospiraceae bacterium]|nr:efflux RND transporter periplasmic adaptor subunit [Lachnospiraceae bacterium]
MKKRPDKRILTRILAVVVCVGVIGGLTAFLATRGSLLTEPSAAESDADAAAASPESEEEPELIEPVGSVIRHVPAEFRELSRVTTCQGIVCPDTTEYTYESTRLFGNYGALPGDPVHPGDMLFCGAEDSVEDKIEAIEEENAELLTDFTNYAADAAVDISKAKKTEFEAAQAYQDLCASAPEEDSPWYAGWARGAMPVEKAAKQAKGAREKLEQALKERQEQFDLTYAYNEKRIERLREEDIAAGVTTPTEGVVVASADHLPGDRITEGSTILAVGQPEELEILCEYVSKSVVNKAEDLYCLIEGKRYEVQYEVMEPEEYRRRKQKDGEVYTTFHLIDPAGEVSLGQYAVIVIVEERIPNALCVPREAVSRDDRGSYVYLHDDGESIYTPVQTGSYDAAFVEILSGLQEGDPVICDIPYTAGSKTLTVSRGEISDPYTTDGFLYYPSAKWLTNPAKTGTCYLKELLVSRYEQVEEGQTLARIEIISDDIEIARLGRKIQRQQERLSDLSKKRAETYQKDELEAIDRSVRDRNRTIESLTKQLDKLTRYSGIVEITAPESGIVTDLTERKSGELIDYRERIVRLSPDDSGFLVVEDKGSRLSYGQKAAVTVRVNNMKEQTIEGTIVTVSPWALSRELRTGFSLIRIPQEELAAIAEVTGSTVGDNGYWTRSRFRVEVMTGHMGDVLLVPKNAVYTAGTGNTYVMVRDPDGLVHLRHFVAGGSDLTNYWVAYGDLTEGLEICSE